MRYSNQSCFREQFRLLKRQFLQEGNLSFTDVLSREAIETAQQAINGRKDRIYTPLVPPGEQGHCLALILLLSGGPGNRVIGKPSISRSKRPKRLLHSLHNLLVLLSCQR